MHQLQWQDDMINSNMHVIGHHCLHCSDLNTDNNFSVNNISLKFRH